MANTEKRNREVQAVKKIMMPVNLTKVMGLNRVKLK